MIREWLQEYQPKNQDEAAQALREIMQEVALAGLYRAGFFKVAAFYGGTALRIFYQLPRFSEDLDFSLLEVNPDFSLEPYLPAIEKEFEALGMHVSIKEKKKTVQNNIESAFLKSDTIWKELVLEGVIPQNNLGNVANIKIKIEVDREPPLGFTTEEKLLLRPFSFYVKLFVLRDLFAGKMHALLFRKWQMNVKGRDWYDMEWYITKKVPLDLSHFILRAKDSGDWKKDTMTEEEFRKLLHEKIEAINLSIVIADINRFIPNPGELEKWNKQYFHDLAAHLVIN
ncbi:MAG: nucleotidyl transferase AbiEii/AbiGii toxin family protein [Chitinophagaceae bacterium]|nr:nucleotidyl transferase AbiEii/AbiGii toxin family protein [Chitinophagaceae bacterium]